MIMVVSHPAMIAGEAREINALFAAGLERFHLRKPDATEAAIRSLMDDVDPAHYAKIAWHQWHHVAIRYDTKRLHFPEWMRIRYDTAVWQLLQGEQCLLSTSIHVNTVAAPLPAFFSYTFAGPVFDSISKEGYKALEPATQQRLLASREGVESVAIGGIHTENCVALKASGIRSIAVSGAIWQANDSLEAFTKIKTAWHTNDPS